MTIPAKTLTKAAEKLRSWFFTKATLKSSAASSRTKVLKKSDSECHSPLFANDKSPGAKSNKTELASHGCHECLLKESSYTKLQKIKRNDTRRLSPADFL